MSRILALDYGTKRIGVAVSDPTRTLATALPCLDAVPFQKLAGKLKALIREQEIDLILVGMPRNLNGTYGPAAKKVEEFTNRLRKVILVPIQSVDERWSTVEASRRLGEAGYSARAQKNKIDSASAQVLLQFYLDAPRPLQ